MYQNDQKGTRSVPSKLGMCIHYACNNDGMVYNITLEQL